MYANVLKFHIWILHEKNANVLKFHIWTPQEKIGDLYFFLI